MSLLAPWFLLGLAGIAVPVWLHRLQTRNPKRRPFASAMLLAQNERQLHVQKSLRYLLLLALRIALLTLLALAFAKPLWRRPVGPAARAAAQLHLIIVDTSASMAAADRFARALGEARSIIDALPGGDRALLVSASDDSEVVPAGPGGPTADKQALERALASLAPGAGRLDDGAMVAALETLAGPGRDPVQAHFISDFQDSALPVRFGDLLPHSQGRSIELKLHPVDAGAVGNWAVEFVRRSGDGIDVGVRGWHTDVRTLTVNLKVDDSDRGNQSRTVPASGQAVFRFERVPLVTGDNRAVATLQTSDGLATDNVRYAVIPNQRSESVPLLTDRPDAVAAKYLAAALAAAGGRYQLDALRPGSFDARRLARDHWLMIDDLGAIQPALAARLQTFLMEGGQVFAAVGERAAALPQLPLIDAPFTLRAATVGDALGVGQIDGSHPVLAGLSGWEALSVGRVAELKPGRSDRVLIAASDGTPLLLEHPVGRGRLLLFTSSLNNDWNDLPVQPVFVSFLAQTAAFLAGRESVIRAQTVGASVALGDDGGGQVIDPAGRSVLSLQDTRRARSVKLSQRGFYQVYTADQEALVAVNGDARESDLAAISAEALAHWRAAAAAAPRVDAVAGNPSVAPPFELWRLLLPLLALVVVAESVLANFHLRPGARSA
jgi:hypothetical protein